MKAIIRGIWFLLKKIGTFLLSCFLYVLIVSLFFRTDDGSAVVYPDWVIYFWFIVPLIVTFGGDIYRFFKKRSRKGPPPIEPISRPSSAETVQPSMSAEEYEHIREEERKWLESHYDLSTIESVNAIPVRKDLPSAPCQGFKGPTGELYYYLRYKSRMLEKDGDIDFSIVCMRKSIQLMQAKYQNFTGRDQAYSLVYLLARHGYTDEARSEKRKIDAYYHSGGDHMRLQAFQKACMDAHDLGTDLLQMCALGATCPECAKYQGRVYSISGKSTLFPALPAQIKSTGCVHPGCHHMFFTYIHGSTHIDMNQILAVHPLVNRSYAKNIVVFSNRPFVDDRTDECKEAAEISRAERAQKAYLKHRRAEIVLESQIQKGKDYEDYDWIKKNIPDLCPASPTGYRRMKTQNTKNYQKIKERALLLGKSL